MTMQMNLVPLLPSFPFSGHANGAKWVKMGKKKLKMGKNSLKWSNFAKIHKSALSLEFLEFCGHANGAKWVKAAQNG